MWVLCKPPSRCGLAKSMVVTLYSRKGSNTQTTHWWWLSAALYMLFIAAYQKVDIVAKPYLICGITARKLWPSNILAKSFCVLRIKGVCDFYKCHMIPGTYNVCQWSCCMTDNLTKDFTPWIYVIKKINSHHYTYTFSIIVFSNEITRRQLTFLKVMIYKNNSPLPKYSVSIVYLAKGLQA